MVTRVSFVAHTSWCLRNLAKQRKDGENKTCPRWWDMLPSLTVNWLAGLLKHQTVCGYKLTRMVLVPAWDSRFGHFEIRQEIKYKTISGVQCLCSVLMIWVCLKIMDLHGLPKPLGFPHHRSFHILRHPHLTWDALKGNHFCRLCIGRNPAPPRM